MDTHTVYSAIYGRPLSLSSSARVNPVTYLDFHGSEDETVADKMSRISDGFRGAETVKVWLLTFNRHRVDGVESKPSAEGPPVLVRPTGEWRQSYCRTLHNNTREEIMNKYIGT